MSHTHNLFGRAAWNCRRTRSCARSAVLSAIVVHFGLPRRTPRRPISRIISRAQTVPHHQNPSRRPHQHRRRPTYPTTSATPSTPSIEPTYLRTTLSQLGSTMPTCGGDCLYRLGGRATRASRPV